MIKLRYSSIDGFRQTRSFKSLAGARKFAHKWVGKDADLGSTYAVSGDGVGKIEIAVTEGDLVNTTLNELFDREREQA